MTSSVATMAQQKSSTQSRHLTHIRELDGVRGLAALMVVFHHICFTSISPEGWGTPVRLLRTISAFGDTGVDLFFMLSGFLITSLLVDARRQPSYYHDFYWKRALRILPLYSVCLIAVFLFMPDSRAYVILSALFLSNFATVFHIVGTGPFWTLAIEEQFYLLWPTVVRRRSIAQLRRWAIAVALSAVALRLLGAAFGHHNYELTFFRCDGLAFGAILACWFYQRDPTGASRLREIRHIAFAFVAGTILIAVASLPETHPRTEAFLAALKQTGITLLFGSIIAFLIANRGHKSLRWLRFPALTFFGLISYAMYMIHLYVLVLYDHLRSLPAGDNVAYLIRFFVVFFVTIALCLLSRYLIELPATSLRKYVLARPNT